MAEGTLITESLRIAVPLRGFPLRVDEIVRRSFDDGSPQQPAIWTFVRFTVDDATTPALAMALAEALDEVGGWYCDIQTALETFVVFPRKVFRYPRGDEAGREDAAAHARQIGIPESQIDWPE